MNTTYRHVFGSIASLTLFALVGAACSVQVGPEGSDGELAEEPPAEASGALTTSANLGHKTKLAITIFNGGSTACSGSLVQHANDPTTTFAITASHCIPEAQPLGVRVNPAQFSVRDFSGATRTVTRVHRHPISNWGDIGYLDNIGKVDVALLEFSPPLTLASNTHIGSFREAEAVIQEGCGQTNNCDVMRWTTGNITPSSTYTSRDTTDIDSVPGDSGGPLWQTPLTNGSWGLEAIHTSGGNAVDASAFHEWANRVVGCGGFDINYPNTNFCTPECPCGVGEGDCDPGTCRAGLYCANHQGALVGLPDHYDICLPDHSYTTSNSSGFCATIGGCGVFEGDCNSHDDCLDDLVCNQNVGLAIGRQSSVDVCDLPRLPECPVFNSDKDPTGDRCTEACPCALGEGDCVEGNDATCRGILRCQRNVGSKYGYSSNSVDVCVHPDVWVP